MIIHAETLYTNDNYKRPENEEKDWQIFLQQVASAADETHVDQIANTNGSTSSSSNVMNNEVLKTIIQHLTRFESLQTKSLLNVLTQADLK